jgi:regulator of nucleoside diphosphate kinase
MGHEHGPQNSFPVPIGQPYRRLFFPDLAAYRVHRRPIRARLSTLLSIVFRISRRESDRSLAVDSPRLIWKEPIMSTHAAPPAIVVTKLDYERLLNLVDSARATPPVGEYLANELDRARVVEANQIAPTVVTMQSRFVFRDESTGETRTVSLVYPGEENIDEGCISILTPVGAALLGLSEGQSIEWETLTGESRVLTVVRLLSQAWLEPRS